MSEEYMELERLREERNEYLEVAEKLVGERDSLRAALRARVEDTDRLRRERDEYWEKAEGLKERVAELEAKEPAPLTMEALDEAFYGGKVSPTCKAGDIVITRERGDWYTIIERRAGGDLVAGHQRILASAPEPEPWRELADMMLEDELVFEEHAEEVAQRLYELGVRVTDDEER